LDGPNVEGIGAQAIKGVGAETDDAAAENRVGDLGK